MNKALSTLAFAALLALTGPGHAAVVTFDMPALVDVNVDPTTYDESGFRFSGAVATFLPLDGIGTGGTPGLLVCGGNALTLTALGGGPFNLLSFDSAASDLCDGAGAAVTLLVSGMFDGKGEQTQELLLDNTGVGFQSWSNLTAVTFFSTGSFVLDNINAVSVPVSGPEPGSLALVAAAMGGLVVARRRRAAFG